MSSETTKQPVSQNQPNVVPVEGATPELTWEERIQLIWLENKKTIIVGFLAVVAVVVGRELIAILLEQRQQRIAATYLAAEKPEQLKAFVADHPEHQLAGLAWLRLADEAYAAGRYADAATAYEKAMPIVSGGPFAGRAAVGAAVSRAQAGESTQAETALKALVADEKQLLTVRNEARFQLAALSLQLGRPEDARKLLDEVLQTDLSGVFARRVMTLQMALPPVTAPAADAAPASSDLKLTLPAKP